MMSLNLRSRTANKVFQQLWYLHQCTDFDTLFHALERITRNHYIPIQTPIVITVQTHESKLQANKVIQSVAHKAVIVGLTGSHHKQREINEKQKAIEVLCTLNKDHLSIYINTSGDALYKRWYKTGIGEAPLKENIAAAMMLYSKRNRSTPLLDPCCWSGTIAIEAALIASHKAPWLQRTFDFQHFPSFDRSIWNNIITKAKKEQQIPSTSIQWRDIDKDVLQKAKDNADNAGVWRMITRKHQDMLRWEAKKSHIITNPPYGKRLNSKDIDAIHQRLIRRKEQNTITMITSYDISSKIDTSRSIQETKNGTEKCKIYSSQ